MADQNRNPKNNDSVLFKKLTRMFSGPLTNRRTQTYHKLRRTHLNVFSNRFKSLSGQTFKKRGYNPFQNLQTQRMANQNRAERYREFDQMEYEPLIAAALDIYADEMTTSSPLSPLVKIDCQNEEIKLILDNLYYNVLNVEHNLYYWVRTMCKYGDFFLYCDIDPDYGVNHILPIPGEEIERLEGEDQTNPLYVQFQWNSAGMTFENWQILHFRILGHDKYAPYGTGILEPCRRIWRQLLLLEDSVMAYRIVRSPERRVFYIDVGSVPPQQVEQYMEEIITNMKRHQIVDEDTGRVDLRYNPLCHFGKDIVYLCDGTTATFEELSENWEDYKDDTYVWSLDSDNNVVPTKLLWAGETMTAQEAEFLEVELDDGQIIRTTPGHHWMLRDGTKVKAEELRQDQSVMPFYSRLSKNVSYKKKDWRGTDNFYIDIYHPGKDKWHTGHKTTALWKYGDYKWPDVIHHEDHIKFNNRPDNLTKMNNADHLREHAKLAIGYNKSDQGRLNSSKNMKKLWKEGKLNSELCKEMWEDEEIRRKRVDSLSLRTDTHLIHYTCLAIAKLGTKAREYEIRKELNNNPDFQAYLKKLNPDFNNGFNDKLTKNQFRYHLRNHNFENVREVKDYYVANKAPWEKIVAYCNKNNPKTRKEVSRHFEITRYDLKRQIKSHGMTLKEFDKQFIDNDSILTLTCDTCGTRFERQRSNKKKTCFCSQECYWQSLRKPDKSENNSLQPRNHKIVAIREYSGPPVPAYGVTVENPTHTIAIGGENAPLIRGEVQKSGVFVFQSVDEDYFIPVRGQSQTKIDTLSGGQYTGDIDDIKYLQAKLIAGLKIPQSYLVRDETASEDKETLAQKDIRFARTILKLQKPVVSELEKIGVIHLVLLGYGEEDALSFKLSLNNPSKLAELQELEEIRTKVDAAGGMKEVGFSHRYIMEKVFEKSHEEIVRLQRERKHDMKFDSSLEAEAEAAMGGLEDMEDLGGDFGGEGLGDDEFDLGGDFDLDAGEEGDSPEDDNELLATPGKRDEYTTPRSKGKKYRKVKDDKRDMGARRRSLQGKWSREKSKNTNRNVRSGMPGLSSMMERVTKPTILERKAENRELELKNIISEIRNMVNYDPKKDKQLKLEVIEDAEYEEID